jgi:Cdc6-like AAA superfamily ATPase
MNLDWIKTFNESCAKSLQELNSQSNVFLEQMNNLSNDEKDPQKIEEIAKAKSFMERLFSNAKSGNMSEVLNLTKEIEKTYGSRS